MARRTASQLRGQVSACSRLLAIVLCTTAVGSVPATELPFSAPPIEDRGQAEEPQDLRGVQNDETTQANATADWKNFVDTSKVQQLSQPFTIDETPRGMQPLLMHILLENIPHDYDNTKKWGGTREVWSGVNVRLDDWQIKTKRRKKEVNHGTWKRYQIELVDPAKNVHLRVANVREDPETRKVAFDMRLAAKLDVYGRVQEWNRGVRLISLSADATADVELEMTCLMATWLDITHIPPDLVLAPEIQQARLQLKDFKLHRLSKADGPVVHELSHSVEKILRKNLAEKNDKLAAKMNRQIDKHADDLRISVSELVKNKLFGKDATNAISEIDTGQ
ncbi:MAG: hypothetical protein KDA60_19280 [Planctomycetales bacterium]|nr:hypothetical protein [Planctomycetales bacterium]